MTATATPETVAASLFVAAFNTVFEDDPRMTIALHMSSGSSLLVTGRLDDFIMRFNPAEISTFLAWLTRAVATDPHAVIAVIADRDDEGEYANGWAWFIGAGDALPASAASSLLPDYVDLKGAEEPHVTLGGGLVDTSGDGLSGTSLTEDVKAVVTAHGEPPKPATGHRIALKASGAITVHFVADGVGAAREALREIEFEDFEVEFRTGGGHVIGCVTLDDAESAELVSVDGVDADELADDETE
jgi:hypothetical protein